MVVGCSTRVGAVVLDGTMVLVADFVDVAVRVLVAVGVIVDVAVKVKVGGMGVKVGSSVAVAAGSSIVMSTRLGDSDVEAGSGADDGAHETRIMTAIRSNRFIVSTDDQHVGVFDNPTPAAGKAPASSRTPRPAP